MPGGLEDPRQEGRDRRDAPRLVEHIGGDREIEIAGPVGVAPVEDRGLDREPVAGRVGSRELERGGFVVGDEHVRAGPRRGESGEPHPGAHLDDAPAVEIELEEMPPERDRGGPDVGPVRDALVAGELRRIHVLHERHRIGGVHDVEDDRAEGDAAEPRGAGRGRRVLGRRSLAVTGALGSSLVAHRAIMDRMNRMIACRRPQRRVLFLSSVLALALAAPASSAGIDFSPARRDFVAGRLVRDVAAIDFDEDGLLDLACVRFTFPGAVTLLRGDGAGHFTFASELVAGDGATSILAADFDEDGHVDLITTGFVDQETGTLGFHRNEGGGVFTTTSTLFPGENPFHVNGGDFDGDGHLDLVAGGTGDGLVRVLTGDGTGRFKLEHTLPGGSVPQHVGVGDVDADGDLDLAVADNRGGVLLYMGNGAGGFAPAGALATAAAPVWIDIRAAGDPARPFLAVAEIGDPPLDRDGVEVFQWNPDTRSLDLVGQVDAPGDPSAVAFLEPVFFHEAERSPAEEAYERRPGLAVASQSSAELRLFRSLDAEPLVLLTTDTPTAVRIADWDQDGIRDLVLPSFNLESVSFFAGSGALAAHAPAVLVSGVPLTVRALDFDGNAAPDLAVLRRNARQVTVLRGGPLDLGVPTFTLLDVGALFPDVPTGFAAFDLGDDAVPDFAVGRAVGSQLWILRSSAAFAREEIFMAGAGPTAIEAADLDGDGRADLAAALYLTDNISVHFGAAGGGFAPPLPVAAGDGPYALAVADLDANGLLDLVTSDDLGRSLSVALQGPPRAFAPGTVLAVQVGAPRGVAAGHLDDDAFLDLAVGGELGLEIFAGDGAGGFAPARFIATAAEFEAVRIADLDQDGRADLVAVDRIGNAVAVYPGAEPRGGRDVGYPPLAFGVDRGPADLDLADLDGDGWLDLAVLDRQDDKLTMLLTGRKVRDAASPGRSSPVSQSPEPLRVAWTRNPFTVETAACIDVATAAPLVLEIFDVTGRRVARVAGGPPAPGRHVLAFTGRDERGRSLARGVYFYRVAAGDRAARGKLVKR